MIFFFFFGNKIEVMKRVSLVKSQEYIIENEFGVD